jgi:hypothetical protein
LIPRIAILARLAASKVRRTTGKKMHNLKLDIVLTNSVPEVDTWRLPLLCKLVDEKMEIETMGEDTTTVEEVIWQQPLKGHISGTEQAINLKYFLW